MTDEGNITDADIEAAIASITYDNIMYMRRVGDLGGWCARLRALLSASRVHPAGEPFVFVPINRIGSLDTSIRVPLAKHVSAEQAHLWMPLYTVAPSYADAIRDAVKVLRKIVDSYVEEHGTYDPETGATEFPGNGDEYVAGLEEQIEAIEALTPGSPP